MEGPEPYHVQSVLHLGRVRCFEYELFDLLKFLVAPTLKTPRVMKNYVGPIWTRDGILDVVYPTCAF